MDAFAFFITFLAWPFYSTFCQMSHFHFLQAILQSIFEMQLIFSHILNSVEHVEENVKTQYSGSEKLNHKKAYKGSYIQYMASCIWA